MAVSPHAIPDLRPDPREDFPSTTELAAALRQPPTPVVSPTGVEATALRINDLSRAGLMTSAVLAYQRATAYPPSADSLLVEIAGLRAALAMREAELMGQAYQRVMAALEQIKAVDLANAIDTALSVEMRSGRPTRASRGRRRSRVDASTEMVTFARALLMLPPQEPADPRAPLAVLTTACAQTRQSTPHVPAELAIEVHVTCAEWLAFAGQSELAIAIASSLVQGRPYRLDQAAASTRAVARTHAVMAQENSTVDPVMSAQHAVFALEQLQPVDDPYLRCAILTEMLPLWQAMELEQDCELIAQALQNLHVQLQQHPQRVRALLTLANYHQARHDIDQAVNECTQARRIASSSRDHHGVAEASRLAVSIYKGAGQREAVARELEILADALRHGGSDLLISPEERSQMLLEEISAYGVLLSYALDAGERNGAEAAADAILRRVHDDPDAALLPAELVWDSRVHALMGKFLALTVQSLSAHNSARESQQRRPRRAKAELSDDAELSAATTSPAEVTPAHTHRGTHTHRDSSERDMRAAGTNMASFSAVEPGADASSYADLHPTMDRHRRLESRREARSHRGVPARQTGGVNEQLWTEYDQRRRSVLTQIGDAPAGHETRAQFWSAYLDDRHAHFLADHGNPTRARRAATRASNSWHELGDEYAGAYSGIQDLLKTL